MADIYDYVQDPLVGNLSARAEGTRSRLRAERMGGLVVQPAHGEMYEEASRANVWTISTAVAGVVGTAAAVVGVSAARPIVGLYNPTSNMNLHITRAVLVQVSGTAVTGGFVWSSVASPTLITSSGVSARRHPTFATGGHQGMAFDGSTIATGITTTVLFRYFGGFVAGAISAGQNGVLEETETDLVVGPGAFLALMFANAGTNSTAAGSLSWAEIPA